MFQMLLKKLKKRKAKKKEKTKNEEENLIEGMGLQAELKEIQAPLFVAQINFETLKHNFKLDRRISRSGPNGYMDHAKLGRHRMLIKLTKENRDVVKKYVDAANNSFGIRAEILIEKKVAVFEYTVGASTKWGEEKKEE